MLRKLGAPIALFSAAALVLTGCAANETPTTATTPTGSGSGSETSTLSGTLTGRGASSMKVAQEKWIADFQSANTGVTINYNPDGSGSGRKAFQAGAVQFAGSDRAFKDDEMGAGKFGACASDSNALNLPIYVSPIAIIFNIEGVTELKLDAKTTASIFAGKITKWNDPAIVALNPDANLPDAAINAVHRSDDSGTTENFADYLKQAAPDVWTPDVSGEWPTEFKGEAAKGTAGVVQAVSGGKNAIGYADESQAGALGKAVLKAGDTYLGPTPEAAAAIVDKSKKVEGRGEHDYALKLDRTVEGAYPVVLVSYAIVCEKYAKTEDAALVKSFIGYAASAEGQQAAQKVAGNAPLSDDMGGKVKAAIDSIS